MLILPATPSELTCQPMKTKKHKVIVINFIKLVTGRSMDLFLKKTISSAIFFLFLFMEGTQASGIPHLPGAASNSPAILLDSNRDINIGWVADSDHAYFLEVSEDLTTWKFEEGYQ
jgi:hypothetical protein